MKTFGLTASQFQLVMESIHKVNDIQEAIIFGSRALGTHRNGSDIDIAIKGPNVSFKTVTKLNHIFEESNIIFKVDVIDYANIENDQLKKHIDTHGISIL